MPADIEQPLAVVFTLPGGEVYRRVLHDLPNQSLAAGLAVGLVAATHPHGPIRTRSVASQYVQAGRRMVRELAGSGFTAGIAGLTPAAVVQYWLSCDFHRERRIRVILRGYAAAGGDVHPGVLRHLEGRRINAITPSRPNRPYSESEWQRLSAACTGVISAARLADRDAAAPGGSADRSVADRARYPDVNIALAYLTLFAMHTGIVPDGIDRLTMSDITRTSATSILLSYNKGRTGRETLNLSRGAVRLLDRWLNCSAGLRARAADVADQLWIFSAADDQGPDPSTHPVPAPAMGGNGRVARRRRSAPCPARRTDPRDLPPPAGPLRLDRADHDRPQPQCAGRGRSLSALPHTGPTGHLGGDHRAGADRSATQGRTAHCADRRSDR